MQKTDIAKTGLYFKKLVNVLPTHLGAQRVIHVDGRHSDAFCFIVEGSCRYTFPNEGYSIVAQKNDILYLGHHAVYRMDILTPQYSSIYCDFEFDTPVPGKSAVYPQKNPAATEQLFRKLLTAFSHPSAASFARCMSLLYEIHQLLLNAENADYAGKGTKDKLARAKKYMDEHYTDSALSIRTVAEEAGMSEEYLRRLFKAHFQSMPSKYITALRLNRAIDLMQYPFLTLEDCALQSGFSSLQYFCHVFKAATGITPTKYRKAKK